MKKKLTYRHLDNDSTMEVILHLYEEEGHWVAKIESSADAVKTTGHFISIFVKFTTGMQNRHDNF